MAKHLPVVGGHPQGPAATVRSDPWWAGPTLTFTVLMGFIVYANWALFQAQYYWADPYLSPFYSPTLFVDTTQPGASPIGGFHGWFGEWPTWWPDFIPPSPAMLILLFPLSFRFTCYYYRKAYYRSFVGSPPGCAVTPLAAGKRKYRGEAGLLIFQNLHRFALYFALAFVVFLSYDAYAAFFKDGRFGVGVGSIVLTINALLIAGYTFGCHSFRHLIGGGSDCMSCGQQTVKYTTWKRVSWLNERHMMFAWLSLLWVAFTDIYVRLVSMGIITDINTW
jgi:hypothetical protein